MGQRMRTWIAATGLAVAAAASGGAYAQSCAGFGDVPSSEPLCPNVEWVKNRAVTLGCNQAGSLYCPDQGVIRLHMAAFMKRLGKALTPIQLRVDAQPGAADLDIGPVVCQTAGQTIDAFPRRAYADAVFSGTSPADVTLAADLVTSTDGGATWVAMNTVANKGSIGANQWAGLSDIAFADLDVGPQVRKWGIRLTRGGVAGTANVADSRCQLRVLLFNRDGTTSPL